MIRNNREVASRFMDTEKIGYLIKDIRLKNNMTQADFAQKYNVTAQAVSKWEKGKNIPDIAILKQICDDYHISFEGMLDGKASNQKSTNYIWIIGIAILLLIIIIFIFHKDNFEFKTITANCDNFNISGSIAYSRSNSHLHLSNINYCGGNENNFYKHIECSLYEKRNNVKVELDKDVYDGELIKLESYLEKISFTLTDFSKSCGSYNDNSLYLEINATKDNDEVINYQIPLSLNNACK